MSSTDRDRHLIEAMQQPDHEALFRMIAALGNCLDRGAVIETMQHLLGIDPVENDNRVLFDDIAVSFDEAGRVKCMYRVIDGSETPTRPLRGRKRA